MQRLHRVFTLGMSFSYIAEMKWMRLLYIVNYKICCALWALCVQSMLLEIQNSAYADMWKCMMRIVTNCDGMNFEVFLISFLCRISAQGFRTVSHLVYSEECWKYSR